ncbi:MAG TPA: hypothetical protein VHW04_14515 [Solirubrobacteraceae bacterium]|nr:hypothetical protein [Solirubrobacteraceae bacterium]
MASRLALSLLAGRRELTGAMAETTARATVAVVAVALAPPVARRAPREPLEAAARPVLQALRGVPAKGAMEARAAMRARPAAGAAAESSAAGAPVAAVLAPGIRPVGAEVGAARRWHPPDRLGWLPRALARR